MLYIKFGNRKTLLRVAEILILQAGVLRVKMGDTEDENTANKSGFLLYTDACGEHLIGDYSNYKTIYKTSDENGMYLSTGEVYVASPVKEKTATEIAEEQKQVAIQNKLQQINDLKRQIDSSDYKIIKSYEYSILGLTVEYDLPALHAERQALRDQINVLEIELEELEA